MSNNKMLFQSSQLHNRGNLSPIRPRQKMPTVYRHRLSLNREQNKQDNLRWPKDNSFLRKRRDDEIQLQRSSMIMKSGRTSEDNPQWMTVNFDHYKKSNVVAQKRRSLIEEKEYDVLNNPKSLFPGRNQDKYFINMYKQGNEKLSDSKTTFDSSFRSTLSHNLYFQPEITAKVGSINRRDYTIYRPQLKVGSDAYIDTYTPF